MVLKLKTKLKEKYWILLFIGFIFGNNSFNNFIDEQISGEVLW